MDRRKDRMKYMKKHLGSFNIKYERISAVDGKEIEEPKLNKLNIPPKYWNKYALGLVRTFNKVICDAIEKKYSEIIIFEDDVILDSNFREKFVEYKKQLPHDWDIVQLSGGNHRKHLKYVTDNIFQTSNTMGTYAMIINSKCFRELKITSDLEYAPIDDAICRMQKKGNCYMFYPGIVKPQPGYSDIVNIDCDYNKSFQYQKSDYVEKIINIVKTTNKLETKPPQPPK